MCPRRKACLLKRRQQHGWTCPQPHENSPSLCMILRSFMSVHPIHETQKSQSAMEDCCETRLFSREKRRHCLGSWTRSSRVHLIDLLALRPGLCVRFLTPGEFAGQHKNLPIRFLLMCHVPSTGGHVRLPPAVSSSVASSLFSLAGG